MEQKEEPKSWIGSAVILLGLFAGFRGVLLLEAPASMLFIILKDDTALDDGMGWYFLASVFGPVVLFSLCRHLIRSSDKIARRPSTCDSSHVPSRIESVCKLACVFCGILVLSWTFPTLGQVLVYFTTGRGILTFLALIRFLVGILLGGYLVRGASSFATWQTRRITAANPSVADASLHFSAGRSNVWIRLFIVLVVGLTAATVMKRFHGFFSMMSRILAGYRMEGHPEPLDTITIVAASSVPFILLAAFCYYLIRYCNVIACRVRPVRDEQPQPWESLLYSLGVSMCGVLLLARPFPGFVRSLLALPVQPYIRDTFYVGITRDSLIYPLAQIVLGCFLIYLAPNVIKWDVSERPFWWPRSREERGNGPSDT